MKTITVRVDESLIKEIQKWLEKNGNIYKHPSVTAYINSAIYDKLKKDQKNG